MGESGGESQGRQRGLEALTSHAKVLKDRII